MKTKVLAVLLAVAVSVMIGCVSSRTSIRGMYEAPNYSAAKNGAPEKIRVFDFALNTRMDVADTAFLPDLGINMPSLAWKFAYWKKLPNGKYELFVYKAIRRETAAGVKFLQPSIPGDMEISDDDFIAVPDHAARRIYNQKGNWAMGDYRKIDPKKYGNFLTSVKDARSRILVAGTDEYNEQIRFYCQFIKKDAEQVQELAYAIVGVPMGTPLNQEQLEIIGKNPWFKERLKESLVKNWVVFATYPVLTPEAYGAQIVIGKLFDISRLIWEDDPTQPGYMDRTLTAAQGYDMMEYYWQKYQMKMLEASKIVPEDLPLPAEIKEKLKGTPCEGVKTYGEQNKCFTEYNRKAIDAYNAALAEYQKRYFRNK